MKKHLLKTFSFLFVFGLFMSFAISAYAIDLNYSGGSTSNNTAAGPTTSGFLVTFDDPVYKNTVGYRFSIVDGSGNLKSGSKVVNIYLDNISYAATAYSSFQRFVVSSGQVANKIQLANNTPVSSTTGPQTGCEYLASDAFDSIPSQNPADISSWIQDTSGDYKNLDQVYAACGLIFANAGTDDYVLIEPILQVKLAGVWTAATPTEFAIYGASISGGGQYNGANGKLYNTGSDTLWNLQLFMNRHFPNLLYVDKDMTIYSAVSVKSSGLYTYNDIIQKGYGCAVLSVSNAVPPATFTITYDANGGTGAPESQTLSVNEWGTLSTQIPTREGYKFVGWQDHNDYVLDGLTWHWYTFNAPFYANANGDVLATYGYDKQNLISHWMNYVVLGNENRTSSEIFNVAEYLNIYPALGANKPVGVSHWNNYRCTFCLFAGFSRESLLRL